MADNIHQSLQLQKWKDKQHKGVFKLNLYFPDPWLVVYLPVHLV